MRLITVGIVILVLAILGAVIYATIKWTGKDDKDVSAAKKWKGRNGRTEAFEDYSHELAMSSHKAKSKSTSAVVPSSVGGASPSLTDKENELFQDLKENKLSTEQITDLVKGGVLNERLVEKFLSELNAHVDDNTPKASGISALPVEKDESGIEGFTCGGTEYAQPL